MLGIIFDKIRLTKIVLFSTLLLISFGYSTNDSSLIENTKKGFLVGIIVLIILELPLNKRKTYHMFTERFANVVKIVFLLYILFLIVLLFNNPKDGLTIINTLFPNYAQKQPPKFMVKTKSCEFKPTELLRDIDEYFFCHLFGWLLMSLFTKDVKIIFLLGLFDEVFEFTFRELIPLFGECWFDQIIYDMLITNITGLLIGYFIVKKLGMQRNDLLGGNVLFLNDESEKKKSFWQRICALEVFYSSKRLYYVFVIIFFKCANLIVTFVFFDALWIPIVSIATVVRLFIWGFCYSEMVHETQFQLNVDREILKTKSIYFYNSKSVDCAIFDLLLITIGTANWKKFYEIKSQDRSTHNESQFKLMLFLCFVVESMICFKYMENLTNLADNPRISTFKVVAWSILLLSALFRVLYLFYKDYILIRPPSRKTIMKNE